tara:strand:+ start:255 stop:674 length:420 start_codon:yes stop_codon:yes gene_type:complete
MIKLNKDTANQRIVVTATELVTLTGLTTYFLFGFTSDDTKETKYFVPEDISTNTCRYNEFLITVSGGTESLTGSTTSIDLDINGYYKYNIFQQDNPTNLDPLLASGIVETGKLYLSGDTKPNVTVYSGNSENNTFITYS